MLIECPHCARSYHIATTSIGPGGRRMRCAGCREVWQALAPAMAKDSAAFDPEAHEGLEISAFASSERATAPGYDELYGGPRAPSTPPKAAWRMPRPPLSIMAGLMILAATMGAVAARQPLVRHLPAIAPVFQAIGLPVNLRGLELRHVTSALAGDGAQRVLAIEGEITNVSRSQTAVPLLLLALRGNDGNAIYKWTSPAPKATLAAGETMQFRARLASPPENARNIIVQFAPAGEIVREARR